MTYTAVAIIVLGAGVLAGSLSWLTRRLVHIDVLRRHHEIGSAVFLQLGVIFAVLLAFVFSEVWSEYHVAGNALDQECGHLSGAAILAQDLPPPMRDIMVAFIRQYMTAVVDQEWPAMANLQQSELARRSFTTLWTQAAILDVHASGEVAIRDQILNLLSMAHQNRATRLFEMAQSVPPLLWLLLIAFAVVLVGFLLCFGIEYIISQVLFTASFATGVAFVLVLVHLLDYPFSGALRLPPTSFQTTLQGLAVLSGTAQPGDGSKK